MNLPEELTLRDYFAAQMLATQDEIEAFINSNDLVTLENATLKQRFYAEAVIQYRKADALLEARKK